jgi:hypothetical protein
MRSEDVASRNFTMKGIAIYHNRAGRREEEGRERRARKRKSATPSKLWW